MNTIEEKFFKDIDLNDTFFDSLKNDYEGFEIWFNKKMKRMKKHIYLWKKVFKLFYI